MIATKIKKYLEERGIKHSFLAEKLDYPNPTISAMLNERRKITAEEYLVICHALKLDPNYFADGDNQ